MKSPAFFMKTLTRRHEPQTKLKTWGECLDYTLKHRPTWVHGSGRVTAIYNTDRFTELRGEKFPIKHLNQITMDNYIHEVHDERGVMESTLNRYISAVSTVLSTCYRRRLIDRPDLPFERFDENEARPWHFSKEQVHDMCDYARAIYQEGLADAILFAAYTGLRQGELLKLRACDVDWTNNMLNVGGTRATKTKGRNWRTVPIADEIKGLLKDRCDSAPRMAQIFGDEWHNASRLRRSFEKVRNKFFTEPGFVFHCLRHSFGTWMVTAGQDIRTIQSMMGHKDIKTTLIYAKVTDEAKHRAIARI